MGNRRVARFPRAAPLVNVESIVDSDGASPLSRGSARLPGAALSERPDAFPALC